MGCVEREKSCRRGKKFKGMINTLLVCLKSHCSLFKLCFCVVVFDGSGVDDDDDDDDDNDTMLEMKHKFVIRTQLQKSLLFHPHKVGRISKSTKCNHHA